MTSNKINYNGDMNKTISEIIKEIIHLSNTIKSNQVNNINEIKCNISELHTRLEDIMYINGKVDYHDNSINKTIDYIQEEINHLIKIRDSNYFCDNNVMQYSITSLSIALKYLIECKARKTEMIDSINRVEIEKYLNNRR